ncbi:MAG: efflux RND transporter periplasmic adaptor subunit [Dokdonella sp.]
MEKGDLLNQLRIDRSDDDKPARTPLIVAGVIVVLLLCGGAGWWYWQSQQATTVEAATAAAPSAAASNEPNAVLQATGYVTARRQATVSAQITGTLTDVLIEEGERVEAGQVLARLDDTAQQARMAEARAQVASARSQAGQFRTQLAQNKRDLNRQQELIGRKLVSQQALETVRTQGETLSAQMNAQQRSVELAEAQLRSAQVQLDYTIVRAPFGGVIIAKAAQIGEIISPLSAGGGFTRTGIGTIVDMDSLEIEVDVNESYINRVEPNGKAETVLDAYQDWTIPSHVIAIIPTADRSKATVKVRIGLDVKDPRILPDMGARVSFFEAAQRRNDGKPAAAPKGVLVPASAVVSRGDASVVFVIDGDYAKTQTIRAGQSIGDLRQIEGVTAGTRIVRAPPTDLADGARVRIGEAASK